MAGIDWSQCPILESVPGKVSGAWVFRGTRVPVSAILRNLTLPMDELLENYPSVSREHIETVLDFLARSALGSRCADYRLSRLGGSNQRGVA
jgi:uncharacterized protein (DUF433 family)